MKVREIIEFVYKAKNGNEEAFLTLFQEYEKDIYSMEKINMMHLILFRKQG